MSDIFFRTSHASLIPYTVGNFRASSALFAATKSGVSLTKITQRRGRRRYKMSRTCGDAWRRNLVTCSSFKLPTGGESRVEEMVNKDDSDAAAINSFKLVGYSNFVRHNPRSDRFTVRRFHHVEFWCSDATNVSRRFSFGLGMPIVAKSDISTGNLTHASYLLRSGDLSFLFSAPYSPSISTPLNCNPSIPSFCFPTFQHFISSHGLAVRAVALEVADAEAAFQTSVAHGATPFYPPTPLGPDCEAVMAEILLYGDVVLRYISFRHPDSSFFLPGFEPLDPEPLDYGLRRLDHAVGNVPKLGPAVAYVKKLTGFHEFAEFTAEDVGTAESGLNSAVLANNEETVLLPMNEPVSGTKRRSQIQTYLDHNEGAGVQHLAIGTDDIFRTLREMRKRSGVGGFEFMPSPPVTYYRNLRRRVGDVLTEEQISECENLGILVDRDDQGVLLQIFTKPIGDRLTIFLEIIQRVGCMVEDEQGKTYQKGGCGGFGKGNFSELFKSIEEFEKMLEAKIV
ncbi:4-hydroxyphenylpyruvate dioxygenase [Aristolochia californica]|uniref:4-hydroxyphenylpyruvate dioxygenase n=1 Tax=Aristolochia californica TaxID=171875 RepID=UPI0035D9C05E